METNNVKRIGANVSPSQEKTDTPTKHNGCGANPTGSQDGIEGRHLDTSYSDPLGGRARPTDLSEMSTALSYGYRKPFAFLDWLNHHPTNLLVPVQSLTSRSEDAYLGYLKHLGLSATFDEGDMWVDHHHYPLPMWVTLLQWEMGLDHPHGSMTYGHTSAHLQDLIERIDGALGRREEP